MIKLYNVECTAKGRKKTLVSTYKTMEECKGYVNDYTRHRGSMYMRFWQNQDGSLNIDYGSHYNLLLLKPTCKKSEYEITQWLFNKEYGGVYNA